MNHSSDSLPEVTPSTLVFSTDPVMVTLVQTKKALVFKEFIADIDRDIHCFNRKVLAGKISIGNQENCSPPLQNGPHITNTSHSSPQPMYPIQSRPLKDITNNSSPQNQLHLDNDRKWVCIHRPNFSPNDELLETSLGKRRASSNLENSQPLKCLATSEDVLPNRPSQTAAAGR